MLLLYNLLSFISLLIYLPWLLFKKGPENRLTFLSERLGLSRYTKTDIWVHAVSVGETIACLPFLRILKKEFPDKKIVFSTTTYTGQKIAREKFPEADRIMYLPWDTGLCIKRVVKSLSPEIFITIETELWPVLFRTLKSIGSSTVLLNGRISPGSFKGYKRIRPFMKKVLSYTDSLYMQGKGDAERIMTLGADEKRVGIMGNFKFDIEIDKGEPMQWMERVNGQILLAGSTHKGEDNTILDAYETIRNRTLSTEHRTQNTEHRAQTKGHGPEAFNLKLLLAPRHPERFNEVEELLKRREFNYIRRSKINQESGVRSRSQRTTDRPCPDIILLDTIGELSRIYSKATITFIGGSLLPFGGHNILEPAYWSKPIIFGPHMDNFPIAGEFLEKSAALTVRDSDDIAKTVIELLENTEKARQMGQNARAIVENNKGAVKKALELVRGVIGSA